MSSEAAVASFDDLRLDVHHRAKMPERFAMVRDVGFGGLVLDAGCGLGHFTELIASQTGKAVICVDLMASVTHALQAGRYHIAGDIHSLPLDSNVVDGAWCSNTLMYAREPYLAISELIRVCRPGALLAIKEEDSSRDLILSWRPELDMAVREAWGAALSYGEIAGDGYIGRRIPAILHTLALDNIRVRSYLIERTYPFAEYFQEYVRQAFLSYVHVYRRRLKPALFAELLGELDRSRPDSFFNRTGSHVICIETVVTCRVPQVS